MQKIRSREEGVGSRLLKDMLPNVVRKLANHLPGDLKSPVVSSVALAIFADRRDRRIKSTFFDMSDIGEFNRRDRRINMIKSPGVSPA